MKILVLTGIKMKVAEFENQLLYRLFSLMEIVKKLLPVNSTSSGRRDNFSWRLVENYDFARPLLIIMISDLVQLYRSRKIEEELAPTHS